METFNWKVYIANYEDLRLAGITTKQQALKHYMSFGKNENRTDKNTTELCLLAHKYYVDKCPFYNHTYTPKYHNLLNSLRKNIKKVLEIGIGNIPLMKVYTDEKYKPGGSLRMWSDYFINAHIYGCDILEDVLFNEERITTILLDQSNKDSLNKTFSRISHP